MLSMTARKATDTVMFFNLWYDSTENQASLSVSNPLRGESKIKDGAKLTGYL